LRSQAAAAPRHVKGPLSMNALLRRSIVAVATALAAVTAAYADDITPDPYRSMPRSSMSREEAKAGVLAARANGTLKAFSASDSGSFYLSRQPRTSETTRDAVVAEYYAARRSGWLDAIQSEDSGSAYLARAHHPQMEREHMARIGR
jgi:hypothetical protein